MSDAERDDLFDIISETFIEGFHPRWRRGPKSLKKSTGPTTHPDIEDYVDWVAGVEALYGTPYEAVIQRLRRLYYSLRAESFSNRRRRGGVGGLFEKIIVDTTNYAQPPVEIDDIHVTQETIDALFSTDAVVAGGHAVDVSHVWAALDVVHAGPRFEAMGGSLYFGTSDPLRWSEVLTWAGDLASWWLEWNDRRRQHEALSGAPMGGLERDALFYEVAASKTDKDDMLGDIDGVVISAHYLPVPPSEILTRYYRLDPAVAVAGDVVHTERFHRFAADARLPHTVVSDSPFRVTLQEDGAVDAVANRLTDVADLFASQTQAGSELPFVDNVDFPIYLHRIAQHFVGFLANGIENGDADWPPTP